TSDAIDMDGGNNDLIERVKITGSRARGIIFDGKDIIAGEPRTADGNTIRDCVIAGVPSHGIEFLASRSNTVEGCTITNVAGNGIQITKASTTAGQANKKSSDNRLSGNSIDNSGKDGINVTSSDRNEITGNTVLNSSDDTASRDGIRITSSDSVSCDDNVVSGNTSGDNQAVHTQKYGLNIASSLCHTTVVGVNAFFGNLTGPIRDLGTGTQYG
ncbi:MAG: right-handed parallel beta-helix repeat-containing protein, partial [Thermoleophilaceae bacterium]